MNTSENSENVLSGIEEAVKKGCETLGIMGRDGGKLNELIHGERLIMIPSNRTSFIQEFS